MQVIATRQGGGAGGVAPGLRAPRRAWGAPALCAALAWAVGCTGPGLEPPWSEDDADTASRGQDDRAPIQSPSEGTPPDGFGNATGGGDATGAGGSAGAPAGGPAAGSAGAGTLEPPSPTVPPATSDGGTIDPGAPMGGSDPGLENPLVAIDFVPSCDTEQPVALEAAASCRYPLPDALLAELGALRVATLVDGAATELTRGESAFGCLFGAGYYLDVSVMPAEVVLCTAACTALAAEAQVVAVSGCAAP